MSGYKKTVAIALLAIFVISMVPLDVVSAQPNTPIPIDVDVSPSWQPSGIKGILSTVWKFITDPAEVILVTVIHAVTWFLWTMPTLLFVGYVGIIFDWMAAISLGAGIGNGQSIYATGADSMVYTGWKVFRDLANVLFIFIIIYIGIATILGFLSGNMRKLLVRVVIAAVFINFSLVITGLIIDASNTLAVGFYNAFPPSASMVNWVGPEGGRSLTQPLGRDSGIVTLYTSGTFSDVVTTGGSVWDSFLNDFKPAIFNIVRGIVNVVVGFILLAAAVMFMSRTVVLLLLMIVSPLAFAAIAFPIGGLSNYFNIWLRKLLENAFWAPAFLALYYAVVKMWVAPNGFIKNFFSPGGGDYLSTIIVQVISITIVISLFLATLIVSKKVGAYGANVVIARTKKYAKRGGSFVGDRSKITSRSLAAPIAGRIQSGTGGFARGLRRIPGITRASQSITTKSRGDIEKAEGNLKKLSSTELRNRANLVTTPKEERVAITNMLADRGDLQTGDKITEQTISKAETYQKNIGAKKAEKALVGARYQHIDWASTSIPPSDKKTIVSGMKPDDVDKMSDDQLSDMFSDSSAMDSLYENFGAGHINKIIEKEPATFNKFLTDIQTRFAGKKQMDVVNILKSPPYNNPKLANWAQSRSGKDTLATIGIT